MAVETAVALSLFFVRGRRWSSARGQFAWEKGGFRYSECRVQVKI